MSDLPKPSRILVVMLRRIGDVVLTTPAVRALRKLYPEAELDFLVEPPCGEILEGNPDISRVLLCERRRGPAGLAAHWRSIRAVRSGNYDWVIDYMGNPRSAIITALSGAAVRAGPSHVFHRWAYNRALDQSEAVFYGAREKIRVLRSLGLDPDEDDYLPRLDIAPESGERARRALEELGWTGSPGIIGLVPASRKITRRWPARHFMKLGRLLRDRYWEGARILVFWGPGEEPLAREIVQGIGQDAASAPATASLRDLAALLKECRLVITNCNGPKHIAVAAGVPTLTIHGSSDPRSWNPPSDPRFGVVRREELFCIGCRRNDCPYDLECLKDLAPEIVARRAAEMLNAMRTV